MIMKNCSTFEYKLNIYDEEKYNFWTYRLLGKSSTFIICFSFRKYHLAILKDKHFK